MKLQRLGWPGGSWGARGTRRWHHLFPQENSEAAKRELCARFDALAEVLEAKKSELLERITREQGDKTGFIQSLICRYKEQLEKSSRLVETAIQAMEETGGAAFLMVRPPNLCLRGVPPAWGRPGCHTLPLTSAFPPRRTPSSSLTRKCPSWGKFGYSLLLPQSWAGFGHGVPG